MPEREESARQRRFAREESPGGISGRKATSRPRQVLSAIVLLLAWLNAPFAGAHAADELRIITSGNYPPFVYPGTGGAAYRLRDRLRQCALHRASRCVARSPTWPLPTPSRRLIAGRGDAIVGLDVDHRGAQEAGRLHRPLLPHADPIRRRQRLRPGRSTRRA